MVHRHNSGSIAGADPGGVDGVASHPHFQMKKNKESGFSSNFILN